MVGTREEFQTFGGSQRVAQSPALVQGHAFILIALDDQGRSGNRLCRLIGNLPKAVFVKRVCARFRP